MLAVSSRQNLTEGVADCGDVREALVEDITKGEGAAKVQKSERPPQRAPTRPYTPRRFLSAIEDDGQRTDVPTVATVCLAYSYHRY